MEQGIQFSKYQQEGAVGEQVSCAIPANIVCRMELVGDLRYCGRDDEFILHVRPVSSPRHGLKDICCFERTKATRNMPMKMEVMSSASFSPEG